MLQIMPIMLNYANYAKIMPIVQNYAVYAYLCNYAKLCSRGGGGWLTLWTVPTRAVNGVLLWSVPVENRAMSMGFSVLILHAFGDVPSPVIIGYIDDTWKNPRFTMSVTSLWLTVCIGTWFLSYLVIRNKWCRSASKTKRAGEELLVVHEEET